VLCNQIALAAVVNVIADRYVTFIAAKHSGIASSAGRNRGRRTSGTSSPPANSARQNAGV
jgi:hypothetical protein